MKRKFLKVIIALALAFNMLLSFNLYGSIKKVYSMNQTTYSTTVTSNFKNNYCFSVRNNLNIINTNFDSSNYLKRVGEINEIIIHHSAGENTSIYDIDRMHENKGWGGVGYNFYIRSDGTIYKGRDLAYSGAHCIGKNDSSIGICLEGNFDNHEPTNEQMSALLVLTLNLSRKYDIIKVSPHREYNSTNCPGKYFPLDLFIQVYENLREQG